MKIIGKNNNEYSLRLLTSNKKDISDLKKIINTYSVQKWMDEVSDLKDEDYYEWINDTTSVLFGVEDIITKNIVGFVYYYPTSTCDEYEISYARLESVAGGFISEAIKKTLLLFKKYKKNAQKVVADIDTANVSSSNAIKSAGFINSSTGWVYVL